MQSPHNHLPKAAYPGEPYDQTAPYDWEIEGLFEEPDRPERVTQRPMWKELKDIAVMGGAIMLATAALTGAVEEAKFLFAKDARNVPVKLPPPVRRMATSAVKVSYDRGGDDQIEGSGVKVGPDVVLTAGHLVLEGNRQDRMHCYGSYTTNWNTPGYPWVDQVTNRNAVLDDGSNDMAVLRIRRDDSFDALPTARIASSQPPVGAPVFFINYESGYEGSGQRVFSDRYPNPELVEDQEPTRYKFYGHPAEYAGTVIGHDDYGLLIATGQTAYGPKAGQEVNSHPGASGGPVFNGAGNVIGEITNLYGAMDVSDISREYGVNLAADPSERRISIVRPVTKDILRPLLAGLPEHDRCP